MEKRANISPGAAPSTGRLIADRLLVAFLVAVVVISSVTAPIVTSAQTNADEELGPANADVNCPNFITRDDAQAVLDATLDSDGTDVYGLDGDGNDLACDSESAELDGPELATCANFRLQGHAQALYDASDGDPSYNLDSNDNGVACEIANFSNGGADDELPEDDLTDEDLIDDEPLDEPLDPDEIPSDLPPSFSVDPDPVTADPPDAEGCDVTVQAGRAYVNTDCDDGTVDAGFLPFEGFDDFAVRAENGFGAFDDTSSFTAPSVQAQQSAAPVPLDVEQSAELTTVETQQAAPTTKTDRERPANNNTRVTESEQPARPAKSKVKKADARQRAKARLANKRLQAKRARLKKLKQRRAKQRQARLEAARAARQRDRNDRQGSEDSGEHRERESTPRR